MSRELRRHDPMPQPKDVSDESIARTHSGNKKKMGAIIATVSIGLTAAGLAADVSGKPSPEDAYTIDDSTFNDKSAESTIMTLPEVVSEAAAASEAIIGSEVKSMSSSSSVSSSVVPSSSTTNTTVLEAFAPNGRRRVESLPGYSIDVPQQYKESLKQAVVQILNNGTLLCYGALVTNESGGLGVLTAEHCVDPERRIQNATHGEASRTKDIVSHVPGLTIRRPDSTAAIAVNRVIIQSGSAEAAKHSEAIFLGLVDNSLQSYALPARFGFPNQEGEEIYSYAGSSTNYWQSVAASSRNIGTYNDAGHGFHTSSLIPLSKSSMMGPGASGSIGITTSGDIVGVYNLDISPADGEYEERLRNGIEKSSNVDTTGYAVLQYAPVDPEFAQQALRVLSR